MNKRCPVIHAIIARDDPEMNECSACEGIDIFGMWLTAARSAVAQLGGYA